MSQAILRYYLKIYLFTFLYALFQTSMTLYNVFNSSIIVSRHTTKTEGKIQTFNKFDQKYWFSSIIYREIFFFLPQNERYHKIFTVVLDDFSQFFFILKFPKMAIFGRNFLSFCRKIKLSTCFSKNDFEGQVLVIQWIHSSKIFR